MKQTGGLCKDLNLVWAYYVRTLCFLLFCVTIVAGDKASQAQDHASK